MACLITMHACISVSFLVVLFAPNILGSRHVRSILSRVFAFGNNIYIYINNIKILIIITKFEEGRAYRTYNNIYNMKSTAHRTDIHSKK
jgi:hypothetical protein